MNRNPIMQWAITFPKVNMMKEPISKEDFYKYVPPAEYVICAQEEHEDGTPHFHMGVKLKKGISKSKMLKWLETKFPNDNMRINIQAIKSWDNWNDYCHKEDPEPFVYGMLNNNRKSKTEQYREYYAEKKECDNYYKYLSDNIIIDMDTRRDINERMGNVAIRMRAINEEIDKIDWTRFRPGIREQFLKEQYEEIYRDEMK